MQGRGRPKSEGLLTPREQEVLALIRDGLSNREIGERLDISLAGAKFHVSEIISKLGVTSREEAAAWQGDGRPLSGLSSSPWWRAWVPFSLSLQALPVVLASTAAIGIGVALFAAGLVPSHIGPFGAAKAAEKTPEASACPVKDCIRVQPQSFATLAQAANEASFTPQLPTRLPAGYSLVSIEHLRFPTNPPSRKDVHNDSITVKYFDGAGHVLLISQGFPAMPGMASYGVTPEDKKGTLSLAGRETHWMQLGFLPLTPPLGLDALSRGATGPVPIGGLLLAWDAGRYGPGWEISPDRATTMFGSTFDYGIFSNILSLDELQAIALSVPFIADPGLTP